MDQFNQVTLSGIVTSSTWSNKENGGYFITIMQERGISLYKAKSYFTAFANRPLANQLAKIIEENPGCYIVIQGKLRNYKHKKDNSYHTSILIEKIINWSPVVKQTASQEK